MCRLLVGIAVAGLVVAGCAQDGRGSRSVGSFLDPYCAPDGSVVFYQYSDLKGSYDNNMSATKECPWNRGKAPDDK